jgi:hypothetical protein
METVQGFVLMEVDVAALNKAMFALSVEKNNQIF